MVAAAIVASAYWNAITHYVQISRLWHREDDEIVVFERRLQPIRQNLINDSYKGEIGFLTNRDLGGLPPRPEDGLHWAHTQYGLIPWRIVRGKRGTTYLIADFWDGPPASSLEGYIPSLDAGEGLILFRAKAQ